MGLVEKKRQEAEELFKAYTSEDKAKLAKKYTPAQLKAIEAGESAVNPVDLIDRGVIRTDLGGLPYYEDLSKTRNLLDRPQRYEGPLHPSTRPMTEDEYFAREQHHLDAIVAAKPPPPPEFDKESLEYQNWYVPTRLDHLRAESMTETHIDDNGPVPLNKIGYSVEAPGLPVSIFGQSSKTKAKERESDKVDPRDPDGIYNSLMQETGLTLDDILNLKTKVLVQHRVVNQTRLGKVQSMYCLAVAGNGDGRLGLGQAKGQEIEPTRNNALITAIRNMKPIPRYEKRTIYGEVEAKVSAVEVKLMSRPPGEDNMLSNFCCVS
jgi:small subunit ribosomal protein S5